MDSTRGDSYPSFNLVSDADLQLSLSSNNEVLEVEAPTFSLLKMLIWSPRVTIITRMENVDLKMMDLEETIDLSGSGTSLNLENGPLFDHLHNLIWWTH